METVQSRGGSIQEGCIVTTGQHQPDTEKRDYALQSKVWKHSDRDNAAKLLAASEMSHGSTVDETGVV